MKDDPTLSHNGTGRKIAGCVKTGSQKKRDWFRPVSMKVLKVLDISPVMVNTYPGMRTYLSYLILICTLLDLNLVTMPILSNPNIDGCRGIRPFDFGAASKNRMKCLELDGWLSERMERC